MADSNMISVEAYTITSWWPKFENGAPVMFGDIVGGINGNFEVNRISLDSSGRCWLSDEVNGLIIHNHHVVFPGTSVPCPKLDSWEKLEDDSRLGARQYLIDCLGYTEDGARSAVTVGTDNFAVMVDLVRRAKKLAGVD